jgi:hypothetical protein
VTEQDDRGSAWAFVLRREAAFHDRFAAEQPEGVCEDVGAVDPLRRQAFFAQVEGRIRGRGKRGERPRRILPIPQAEV